MKMGASGGAARGNLPHAGRVQPPPLAPCFSLTPTRSGMEVQMIKLGYKLMSEEHGPADLVRNAKRAEQAGFDFAAISDHYFPWLE